MSGNVVLGRDRNVLSSRSKKIDFDVEKLKEKTIVNKTKANLRKTLKRTLSINIENERIITVSVLHPTNLKKNKSKSITELASVRYSDVLKHKIKLFWEDEVVPERFFFTQESDFEIFKHYLTKTNVKVLNDMKQASTFEDLSPLRKIPLRTTSSNRLQQAMKQNEWQVAKTSPNTRLTSKDYLRDFQKPMENKLYIKLLEHTYIPNAPTPLEHEIVIEVIVLSNSSVHDLKKIAISRLFSSTNEPKSDFELYRPPSSNTSGVWLEPNHLLSVYALTSSTILELRQRVNQDTLSDNIKLKVIMPELHTTKIMQFNKRMEIKECIQTFIKRLHSSNIIISESKYYRLYLVGHVLPLDAEKTLSFYSLNNMDTVVMKRPLIYELTQGERTDNLILEAEMKVKDCLRMICNWINPPILNNLHDYYLYSDYNNRRLRDESTLLSYHLEASSHLYLELKNQKRNESDNFKDNFTRVITILQSPSITPKLLPQLDDLHYHFEKNGAEIWVSLADGNKEALLCSERVDSKYMGQFLSPRSSSSLVQIFGTLVLTNYRLIWLGDENHEIPLGNIHKINTMGKDVIDIRCKDATRYIFIIQPQFIKAMKLSIVQLLLTPFALQYREKFSVNNHFDGWKLFSYTNEILRQCSHSLPHWRFSNVNKQFNLCESYPCVYCVPVGISDSEIIVASDFRTKGRVPILTYIHKSGHTIVRGSQPKVGLKRDRCVEDEALIHSIKMASPNQQALRIFDARPKMNAIANQALGAGYEDLRAYSDCIIKFLNIDNIHVVRHSFKQITELCWQSEWGNLSFGDATDHSHLKSPLSLSSSSSSSSSSTSTSTSTSTSLPSILTSSSSAINQSSTSPSAQKNISKKGGANVEYNWYSGLDNSRWFDLIVSILSGANKIVNAIIKHDTSVLIHCSDGWDRTSQLASLAQIIIDPFYRTILGFEILIEKDWLCFGHKFADRNEGIKGIQKSDQKLNKTKGGDKERSPIFLQFLDCVYQLTHQFPSSFEFNERFLLEIAIHSTSQRFGTFLFNSGFQRLKQNVVKKSTSLWSYLNQLGDRIVNVYYQPSSDNPVLVPKLSMRHIKLWHNFFFRSQFSSSPESVTSSIVMRMKEQNVVLNAELEALRAEIETLKSIVVPSAPPPPPKAFLAKKS